MLKVVYDNSRRYLLSDFSKTISRKLPYKMLKIHCTRVPALNIIIMILYLNLNSCFTAAKDANVFKCRNFPEKLENIEIV